MAPFEGCVPRRSISAHERQKIWYRCKVEGVNSKASFSKRVECWNVAPPDFSKSARTQGPCGTMSKADEWERCIVSDMDEMCNTAVELVIYVKILK